MQSEFTHQSSPASRKVVLMALTVTVALLGALLLMGQTGTAQASQSADREVLPESVQPRSLMATSTVTMDGVMSMDEGYELATLQDTPTGFGDNSDATATSANGSELDGAYYRIDGNTLYLMLTGNLQTNFNKLDIFFDAMPGGQNQLRGDNPDVDFNGLNRMGNDGSGNGLTFDAGFDADYFLTITNGNDPVETYATGAEILTNGGGTGGFLGGGAGTTVNGSNGIMVAVNNSNTGGVDGANVNSPISVTTGIEVKIPLSVLGSVSGDMKISAFVNGGSHDFISNQVLGGIGGGTNIGEPRSADFSAISGDQFFVIPFTSSPAYCSDIFFSEYIEGSSNNKAVELFNGTGSTINLDSEAYTVERYNNGSTEAGSVYTLTGFLSANDVLVIANPSADAAILAQADVTGDTTFYNGDDALVLKKAGVIIDSIGRVGEDPGSEWGSGDVTTGEHTLVRKRAVSSGDTDPSDAYDPAGEWNGFPQDTFEYLGSHTADCAGLQLLISEIVVTPTDAEFIEIFNPNSAAVDLSNVYLTDATFANGGAYYYKIVTGSDAGGGGFGDFHAQFPDGASIAGGEYQTIAIAGSTAFTNTYGSLPTYELYEDDSSPDSVPDMREARPGLINNQGGLTNGGEVVILYTWNRMSELVTDLDYVVWGDKAEAVDKSGVAIDVNMDNIFGAYFNDTSIISQSVVSSGAHASGSSWQRRDATEGSETKLGGNGVAGHDETSEDTDNTFCENNPPTPGADDNCPMPAAYTAAKIHEIQGSGITVTAAGPFSVTAIVIGDFQGIGDVSHEQLDGFFIQEEDADADGNPMTSEGIFVFCGSTCATDVAVGDLVEVTGTASDFFDMSQISLDSVSVISSSNPLPTPAMISLPGDTISATTVSEAQDLISAHYEPYEGMLVTITNTLYAGEYFQLGRFGEVRLSADGRLRQFTDMNAPSVDGYTQHRIDVAAKTIILDDDMDGNNQALALGLPVFHPVPGFSVDNYIRGGDTISNLTGPLQYTFSQWRIRPVTDIFSYDFTRVNTRTTAPETISATLKVASFNVLNYFTTVDEGPDICGPSGDMDCRGADSAAELQRQTQKIASALCAIDADIVGVNEIENNSFESLQGLVDGVNAQCGPYAYVDIRSSSRPTGTIGTDAIKVGFIYKTATVTTTGEAAILDSSVITTFIDTKNRPALAQTFMPLNSEAKVTIAVNHLKSKGSDCDDITLYGMADTDKNDGQANCNLTRRAAAEALASWLSTDPTNSGDPDFLIIGDLNSYRNEDPITALENAGYTDLLEQFGGAEAYTYLFDGQLGNLDYALANTALISQVVGATAWHINADEVNLLDYNDPVLDSGEASFEAKPDATTLYAGDPYRASDHDPVIVGLNLTAPSTSVQIYMPIIGNQQSDQ